MSSDMRSHMALMTGEGILFVFLFVSLLSYKVILRRTLMICFRQNNADGNLEDWWHPETAARSI